MGIYVGFWLCFIGGLIQVIEAVKAPEIISLTIALCGAKIVFAGLIGTLVAYILVIPGFIMATK